MAEINILSNNNTMSAVIDTSNKSFLCDITFKEVISTKICVALLNSDVLKKDVKSGSCVYDEYQQIQKILSHKHNNVLNVSYKHSRGGVKNLGRVNASVSLGFLRREVRGTLTEGIYIDIDVMNCHPQIINQFLKQLGLSNTNYDKYCNEREDILKTIMDHHKVNRNNAKSIFYVIMYGGSYDNWIKKNKAVGSKMEFILSITQESNKLAEYLILSNPKLYDKFVRNRKNEWNNKLAFLAVCIQNHERLILEHTYNFFKKEKLIINNNCVLCHDGIMLKINSISQDKLNELSDYIKTKTNFKLKYEQKPLKNYLDQLEIETLDPSKLNRFDIMYFSSLGTYDIRKEYFENFVCKCLHPQPHYIALQTINKDDEINYNHKEITYKTHDMTQRQIIEGYRNLKYDKFTTDKKGNLQSFINHWLDDINMLTYSNKDFLPYNDVRQHINNGYTYNLFNGFNSNIKKITMNDENSSKIIKPFLNMVRALCESNDDCFNYFIKTIAHKVQYPTIKLPYAFVMIGKQGTGKSVLMTALEKVFGSNHIISSSKPEDFCGDHAEGIANKLIVNMNECQSNQTYGFQGFIKSLITEDTIRVNPKNIRPYDVQNHALLIFTSNKYDAVSIDAKSNDRRFLAFKSDDKYAGGGNHWNLLVKRINEPRFSSAFYHYLNNMEVDNFDFAKERLKCLTKTYKDMIRRNIPPAAQFLEYYVNKDKYVNFINDELDDDNDNDNEDIAIEDNEYKTKQLKPRYDVYKEYKKWCSKNRPNSSKNTGYTQSNAAFYNTLRELEIPFIDKIIRGKKHMEYVPENVHKHLVKRDWILSDETEGAEEEETEIEDLGLEFFN